MGALSMLNKKDSRNIAFVTTARSDYSTMYPVIKQALGETSIATKVFCAGMHLLEKFGETYRQLENDGIPITEKVRFFSEDDTPMALSESLANGVSAFASALTAHNIDLIVVSGDRVENLALFTAASCLNIPICHLCGGDVTEGAIDNQVRHAMTKLSHLHMVSMQEHYERVVQMGEEPWRVKITGDAALDTVLSIEPYTREELYISEGISLTGELALCTFHPLTLGSEDYLQQFDFILQCLAVRREIPVICFPNIDPGFSELIEKLEAFTARRQDCILKKSFSRRGYYSMMHHAKFMVGNSSSGLWEAPSFSLPCINVGSRQSGRRRADNVIDVKGDSVEEIMDAVTRVEGAEFREQVSACVNPYGQGNAANAIIDTVKNVPIDDRLLMKKFFHYSGAQDRNHIGVDNDG